ncbi:MAG: hypothetical protein L0Y44_05345 [Phycisphaerales bacterium]|nr:hypothetical protein [Phycisphaerales bacterium]MCI0630063.1 hypothetical protein [Phycisphaerales bacterium]MCI0675520.1 hypothetical protein [Phycisphaerales bacterium]
MHSLHNNSPTAIHLSVDRADSLLNPDRSLPWAEQALHPGFTAWLEIQLDGKPSNQPVILELTVPADQLNLACTIQADNQRCWVQRDAHIQRELRRHFHDAWLSLIFGFGVLMACFGIHHLIEHFWGETLPRFLSEGIIILGWIAMWRPGEMLLYDWIPLWKKRKLCRRLASIQVRVSPK